MTTTMRLTSALMVMVLTALPASAQNLLQNGNFETNPPNLFWAGSLDIDSTIVRPIGPIPEGAHIGSVQAGGTEPVRLAHHQMVALSGAGARYVTLTGVWGGGNACAGPGIGQPCSNLVRHTLAVRIHDGDENGLVVAQKEQQVDMGISDDPNLPERFGWMGFAIAGTAHSGIVTVEFGWITSNGAWSDGTGVHVDKLDLRELGQPVQFSAALSQRQHGAAGNVGLPITLSGAPTVEPRQNGLAPRMVLAFTGPPSAADGSIDCGQEILVTNGTCEGLVISANTLEIEMAFQKNACVTVTISGITGLTSAQRLSVLTREGDVNANGTINILDLQAVKNQLSRPFAADNFKMDVTCDGKFDTLDLLAVKNNLHQPAACP